MLRIIFYLILLGLVYFAVKQAFSPAKRKNSKPMGHSEDLVQDPICQCYVPKSHAYVASTEEGKLFFCSEECYKKYLAAHSDGKR
jgi:YHS domain-containing protein